MRSAAMTQRITEMSPRFLARMAAVLGILEGVASVNGQLRIPDRLVITTDAAATSANILGNESLFRLGLALCVLAVAFKSARTVLVYVLLRPVGRIADFLIEFFGLVAIALQAGGSNVQRPVLVLLKIGKDFG